MRPCSCTPKVYPRVYGGTAPSLLSLKPIAGLSPRVRGNPWGGLATLATMGSIPACTGEPHTSKYPSIPIWVYPRVYGGTSPGKARKWLRMGLSPRVRGNQLLFTRHSIDQRSIPACTGEPAAFDGALAAVKVYPRVYGGTAYRPSSQQ